ncbi:hypothetical protein [Pyrobaculum neutrophilum]|uniref:Uncharacterized protein n=1 Tax=Pyrobaculum neutrophilum (strain DSM 2338 / JCM 9278 / NBRC 100436 / V24Sta) TaxID=444157 RepID=B1YAY6_PYRNV|nr:hypothetical protein [Pyrobaculum neutrophilum]ACB40686.1 hypothetical protein Tneu_1768 [Pyrobaculum neutrophilum V24Sta]
MKAYLVTRDPRGAWPRDVKILYLPFAEEDVLYVVDERRGFVEISGREKIEEFIGQLRSGRRTSQ